MTATQYYLTRRNNGIYYLGTKVNGSISWKTTKCRRKIDALHYLRDFKQQAVAERPTPLLSDFLTQFFDRMQGTIRPNTLAGYKLIFNEFKNNIGNKPLNAYTAEDVYQHRDARQRNCKPETVKGELSKLRSLFSKAEKWGVIDFNVFKRVPPIQVPKKSPLFMTKAEFQALHEATKEQVLKDVYLFCVLTGCRISETLQLRWSDIDFQSRTIRIANSETFITKTGKERHIPINDSLLEMLKQRREKANGIELVFHKKGYQISRNYATHKFKKYARNAKLNPAFKLHRLRHTFASWLVQDGSPIYTVSKLLGHSSVVTTEIYSHLAPNTLLESVNRITL